MKQSNFTKKIVTVQKFNYCWGLATFVVNCALWTSRSFRILAVASPPYKTAFSYEAMISVALFVFRPGTQSELGRQWHWGGSS